MQKMKDMSWTEGALYVAAALMIVISALSITENLAYTALFAVIGLNSFALARILCFLRRK